MSASRTIKLASDFWSLAKPNVIALVMITAAAGSALALLRHGVSAGAGGGEAFLRVLLALAGVALTAAAAAAFNCLVEAAIDVQMQRTRNRPLPAGRITAREAGVFVALLGGAGLAMTAVFGGALAGILTGLTFFGYAFLYTLYLKRATPQNIVIGGASGAMPPVLGWAATGNGIGFEPLLLFLIIFVWTPPHFWALAIARQKEYAAAGVPMLPVTHGAKFTATQIVLYGVVLFIIAMLPYISGMAGVVYLLAALPLNIRFLQLARRLQKAADEDDEEARNNAGKKLFAYSVIYLALLFAALLADGILRAVVLQ